MSENLSTELLAGSPKLREVLATVAQVAASHTTVLINGETGTGKSTIARAIHNQSPRASLPFVVFDCAAVTPTLVESELFGHIKGAFTGASNRRVGALEAAAGGTLFIDELSELPLSLQPKLLRALEERVFVPLGAEAGVPMACRIIVATQTNLAGLVAEKRFRADLYYRLAVVELSLPPLRERRDDLPVLVDGFFRANGSALTFDRLTPDMRRELLRAPWPGNIRELRNHIERLCVSLATPLQKSKHLDQPDQALLAVKLGGDFYQAKEAMVSEFERMYLRDLLERAKNNVTRAARLGNISRRHLYDLLRKHNLLA